MILEQPPEVQRLPAAEKRQLAEELWRAADESEEVVVDSSIIELLDLRLADHDANPNAVSSWKEVEARVLKRHGA